MGQLSNHRQALILVDARPLIVIDALQSGRLVEYVHMGWGSRYEHEERLQIQSGRVVGRLEVEQSAPERLTTDQPATFWGRLVEAIRGGF